MTIFKRHNTDYKVYLDDLIDCGRKFAFQFPSKRKMECMTEIEQQELAGHIFRFEIGMYPEDVSDILNKICERAGFYIADLIATYCITDHPENAELLTKHIKLSVTDYYADKMQKLLDERIAERHVDKKYSKGESI